ncbi:vWA domain-containing protein [Hymenobacter sp. BT491]|uniref:vWA domain-containing protein n=1 Tax=Hymenobacter sp. BT491 TaxID=2766779 RepID=UPI001653AB10|nr:vWA domain-containing protein [Hymenobacter sp. BT491]MBC6990808.1 VWA domain-containing protein [Hymenobacter sp. BT491]
MLRKLLLPALLLLAPLLQNCETSSDETAPASGGAMYSAAPCPSCGGTTGSSAPGGTGSPAPGGSQATAGVLTAGEWNDLANWSFWQGLQKNTEWEGYQNKWGLYTAAHYSVTLTDEAGLPLSDARVIASTSPTGTPLYETRTDQEGQADLFPVLFQKEAAPPCFLRVEYQNRSFDLGAASVGQAGKHQLPVQSTALSAVDLMFVVDATGSMTDEINYLKAELRDVIARAHAQLPNAQLRMSSVFYRDKQDEYLTRVQPFSNDVDALLNFVNAQRADGGGDFPEAVEIALQEALKQSWSSSARCRLLFLVLDAPPHDEAKAQMQELTQKAAKQGVRIIPVVASGIDRNTEFLMRATAIATNGTYVFLTNHSGIGDSHLEPTIGSYQVEFLNNLLVRLILKYSKS